MTRILGPGDTFAKSEGTRFEQIAQIRLKKF